jgi:dipeptidyl aminopeptidase/acylaminoacyl peptidase
MAEAFRRTGVEHKLISIDGGGHGLGNISPEKRQPVYAEAAVFLTKHV